MFNFHIHRATELFETRTATEFFILMCTLMQNYALEGLKGRSELKIGQQTPRPYLKLTYFIVIGHRVGSQNMWELRPLWVFTLYGDGELIFDAEHFEGVSPYRMTYLYETVHATQTVGLDTIKDELRRMNFGLLP